MSHYIRILVPQLFPLTPPVGNGAFLSPFSIGWRIISVELGDFSAPLRAPNRFYPSALASHPNPHPFCLSARLASARSRTRGQR
jgi:hypothetical protein